MFSFIILFIVSQLAVAKEGVKIGLETTIFGPSPIIYETTIMKKGNKLRIDETLPNSEEIGSVVIWDGKECLLFTPNKKPQSISPIKDGLDFIGFSSEFKTKGELWDIDKVTGLPVKKTTSVGDTYYKDYTQIHNFGALPTLIEEYSKDRLDRRTVVKYVDDEVELRAELFDLHKVKFTEKAKKEAKKLNFE
ncbi:MAG: hypothetical protein QMD71_04410 [bacterium]|nr:hypothetical protein [bacterium]